MKAELPKNKKKKEIVGECNKEFILVNTNQNFMEFMKVVKRCYELTYKKHPEIEDLIVAVNSIIKDSYIDKLCPPTMQARKRAKTLILTAFAENIRLELENKFENRYDKENISDIDALVIMNDPIYIAAIIDDPKISSTIKSTLKDSLKKFTESKLKELKITKKSFKEYLKNPDNKSLLEYISEVSLSPNYSTPTSSEEDNVISNETTKQADIQIEEPTLEPKTENIIKPTSPKSNIEDLFVNTDETIKPKKTEPSKKEKSFYEQVKEFTNGFSKLIMDETDLLSNRHPHKFTNIENYYTFIALQKGLKDYQEKTGSSEIEIINQLLEKKPDELLAINPDLEKILESRKEYIENYLTRD